MYLIFIAFLSYGTFRFGYMDLMIKYLRSDWSISWNLWNFLSIDFELESYLSIDKVIHLLSILIESLVLWDVLSFGALELWIIQCFGTLSDG